MSNAPETFSTGERVPADTGPEILGQTVAKLLGTATDLTQGERRQIIDQALTLIEQVYVHLPFKRAMHAVDPVQRLKLLKLRLGSISTHRFHREMIETFTQLRDLHTNYLLPDPFRTKTAFLPFLVEEFFEGGTRHYIVSKLFPGFSDRYFNSGVIVTHWNGIPIDRAVELNAERQAGSNDAARHARGLDSLTIRPLVLTAPPDEDWVLIRYIAEGEDRELRFTWQIFEPDLSPNRVDSNSSEIPAARALGIDAQTEAIQRVKKILFAPLAIEVEKRATHLQRRDTANSAGPGSDLNMAGVSALPDVFSFRTVSTPHGNFGYIRIWHFQVRDVDEFVAEFDQIASTLPQNGLIIDVRGNPGGVMTAGERLLQVLTPKSIDPERLQFINTPLTLELCERDPPLAQWKASIRQSVETGTTYSDGFTLEPVETYNRLGQRYYGPVILITDALCYSAADMFIAGFQDHGIGPILGTSDNTGAGGANVWTHELLRQILPGPTSPIQRLPKNASFRVAIRRTTRSGARSGTPVEDLGTTPDHLHHMTKNDVLEHNKGLIARAAELLTDLTVRKLSAVIDARSGETMGVSVTAKNISRLDIFLNDRPLLSRDIRDGTTTLLLPSPPPDDGMLELRGFHAGQLVAVRRISLKHDSPNSKADEAETPRRNLTPEEAYDVVTRLHDQGVVDLDEPIRAYVNRYRASQPSEEKSWYMIIGSRGVSR
jgi:hypothetical protein